MHFHQLSGIDGNVSFTLRSPAYEIIYIPQTSINVLHSVQKSKE